MAIWRSKKHQNVKNVGDTEPIYPRQTTVIRVNYFSEVRQKFKDTLKNPSPFTGRPSYKDFKSHPGKERDTRQSDMDRRTRGNGLVSVAISCTM